MKTVSRIFYFAFLLLCLWQDVTAQQNENNKQIKTPGIYFAEVSAGVEKLVFIEPTAYTKAIVSSQSTGNTSSENNSRTRISVEGARAKINIVFADPNFHFYFAKSSSTSNLNDFILVRMITDASRRVLTGKLNNPFEPVTDENKNKKPTGYVVNNYATIIVPLEFEVASGIARVSPVNKLTDGEYCFFYRGSTSLSELFKLNNDESAFCFSVGMSGTVPVWRP